MEKMKGTRALEHNGASGFTLIELMLVVIIIGVLAAMVMPRLVGKTEEAKIAAVKNDLATIGLALDMYEMYANQYPDSLEELMKKEGKGPYLKKTPVDPWGRPYKYEKGADEKDYKLCSGGSDEAKSEDDICN